MNQIDESVLAQLIQLLGSAFSAGSFTGLSATVSKGTPAASEGCQWHRVQFHEAEWGVFIGVVLPLDAGIAQQATELLDESASILAALLGGEASKPTVIPTEGEDGQVTLQLKFEGNPSALMLSLDTPSINKLLSVSLARKTGSSASIMNTLMNVELPVSILIASKEVCLSDVLQWGAGSVIEFEEGLSDPVEIIVNKQAVARGSVVLVDGNYGIRVTEVLAGTSAAGGIS